MDESGRRPGVVTAAAVALFVQALVLGIIGLVALLTLTVLGILASAAKTSNIEAGGLAAIVAVYSIAAPLGGLMAGLGLWRLWTWAWKAALLFELIQLLILGVTLALPPASSAPTGFRVLSPFDFLPLIVISLLLTRPARQAFRRPATGLPAPSR